MTLGYYLTVIRRRWRTILSILILGVALAAFATAVMPNVYAAQARAFVSIASQGSQDDSLYQDSQYALNRVQSYPQIAQSPEVLDNVIQELDLDMSLEDLRERISVVNPVDTVLLEVQASSESAEQAADIANAVAMGLGEMIQELETPDRASSSPVQVTTAVPATTPTEPISPRPAINLALGLLMGLAFGVAIALVRDRVDTTLKSSEEVTALTGASPLGLIRADPRVVTHPLVSLQPELSVVEDFRSVRTALRFVDVDQPPRQIVISSAIPGEGKSTFAANIALTLAQTGAKVCLVEADLRRPRLSYYLGVDSGLGLTDVVAADVSLDDALVPWGDGSIVLLPSGTAPPDPSQILGSHGMEELLGELRRRFDHVLIDAPPVLAVSDAATLGPISDGVVLIARHRHVKREQLRLALRDLESVGARVLGVVLNQVRPQDLEARYGPDYDYSRDVSRSAESAHT